MNDISRMFKEFEQYDGGLLKFEDKITHKKMYFELDFESSKDIFQALKKKVPFYLILSIENEPIIVYSIDEAIKFLNIKATDFDVHILINSFGICDRDYTLKLFNNMQCPEKEQMSYESEDKDDDIMDFFMTASHLNHKKRKLKEKKQIENSDVKFDWNDEFLEGMRIFGNLDEAEAYADEMKRKKTGKI